MPAANPTAAPSVTAGAGIEGFLKIDGIDGESVDARHHGEIAVRSSTFGVTETVVTSGAGGASAGRARFQDLHVIKVVDKASPKLFVACASGQHIRTATLTWRRGGASGIEFLVITLEDVLVTSIQDAIGVDVGTTEDIAFNFGRVTIRYVPQRPDGSADTPVIGGWDVRANARV